MEFSRRWFITGCSSGLGREIAITALSAGHRVVATARNMNTIIPLQEQFGDEVLPLELDVTDQRQLENAVAQATTVLGGVDVLVNNAGYCYLSSVEEGRESAIRQIFDVNFFGPTALIQSFLPFMRAQRSGLIINISSGLGLVGAPTTGFYSATKFAIEGLTEALALEVVSHGIKVMLVEPGPIKTDFSGRSMQVEAVHIDDYREITAMGKNIMCQPRESDLADPVRCAHEIVRAAANESPPFRLPLGTYVVEPAENKWRNLVDGFGKFQNVATSVLLSAENKAV